MKPASPTAPKKPYHSPKLIVYGNLAEITRANSELGMLDGGTIIGHRKTG